jgi:hypothetical protein
MYIERVGLDVAAGEMHMGRDNRPTQKGNENAFQLPK